MGGSTEEWKLPPAGQGDAHALLSRRMTPTPTERIVLFPEPLHHGHAGRRAAAVVCLSAAVGAAGWMLARDTVLRRWHQVGSGSVVGTVVSRAGSVASSVAHDAAE